MFRNALRTCLLAGLATYTSCVAATPAPKLGVPAWHPSSGHAEIPLWPSGYPLAKPEVDGPESMVTGSNPVAGRPWTAIVNVTTPTMTVYFPTGQNTRAAVMVLPGGGYKALAIDLEGTEICDWITAEGMTCILLKYRVPQAWRRGKEQIEQAPPVQLPLQDAQRAMGLIRQRAAALKIDQHKVGVIGFSAGGHLVAALSNEERRTYAPADAADNESARPDFAIALYPGHIHDEKAGEKNLKLAPWIKISRAAPPTFLFQSADDEIDDVANSLSYGVALANAGVPVELHLYPGKAHAFGLRPSVNPISTTWPTLVEKWLQTIGMIQAAEHRPRHAAGE
jgi:acetyl esterase/lipase